MFKNYLSRRNRLIIDKKIQRFWDFFLKNRPYIESGDNALSKRLRDLPYPLQTTIVKNQNNYRMRFYMDKQKYFQLAQQYIDAAPLIVGWEIKLRGPSEPKKTYRVNNHVYNIDDFRFIVGPHIHDNKVEIMVLYRDSKPGSSRPHSMPLNDDIGVYLLEELLGEEVVGRHTYVYDSAIRAYADNFLHYISEDFPDGSLDARSLQKTMKKAIAEIVKYQEFKYIGKAKKHTHKCASRRSGAKTVNFSIKDDQNVYLCLMEMHPDTQELYLF